MFFTAKNHSALILKITSIWLELLTVFCFFFSTGGCSLSEMGAGTAGHPISLSSWADGAVGRHGATCLEATRGCTASAHQR